MFSTCAIEHRSFRVTYAVVMARVAQTRNVVNCNDKVALLSWTNYKKVSLLYKRVMYNNGCI